MPKGRGSAGFRVVAPDTGREHVVGDRREAAFPVRSGTGRDALRALAVVDASEGVAGSLSGTGELLVEKLSLGGGVVLGLIDVAAEISGHGCVWVGEGRIVGAIDDTHRFPQ